ncbi:MAG TPA: pyruvate dehydrogenase (acetyl-transferring) E1 component subunit alpha [Kineosporiaceae bacterium]
MTAAHELGSEPMVQLLSPEGERLTHPDHDWLLEPDELRATYRDLVLVRRLDAEATALQRQGELGLWASLLGQEAAQVGSARAMLPQDHAFPTYREHGVAWCRGVDPLHLLRLFRGTSGGSWDPAVHHLHLYTIVIGAQTLHATGYAMGIQRDGAVGTGDATRDAAVLAYFGDGASSEGDVSEAFVFASVMNAPIVFLCQNNQFAISESNDRQMRVPVYRRSSGFGFPGVRVDGNDVVAVHAVTTSMLDRARRGEGPALIEAFTYRMGAHTTSDDPSRYRTQAEVEQWRQRDPIDRLRRYLDAAGLAGGTFHADLEAEADALADGWRRAVRGMPDPEPATMFDHVHHGPHAQVGADRARFEQYEASFEPAGRAGEGGH